MSDPFCPEASPASGALCGVAANIVHSRHFALDGTTWDTPEPHRVPVEDPADWLRERLGFDLENVGLTRDEFRHLLVEYERRRNKQLWYPPQTLIQLDTGGPMMLRPCVCCRCTGTSACFHADEGGCFWRGPGR